MKFSKIVISLFLCFSLYVKAQLDLEHWFPPVYQTGSVYKLSEFYFYLSTDKITPFTVKVYSNNVLLKTLTISKSMPGILSPQDFDTSLIHVATDRRVMKVIPAGIQMAGEKSFYASLRLATGPLITSAKIADIFSSKGKSGLGKDFFTVMDQIILYGNNPNSMNYFASVIATRDDTHVKVSDYDKEIIFSDGLKHENLEFTLQKGQSYVVAADKRANTDYILDDNDPNLIGVRITSDKPIVVSNGNFVSQDIGVEGGGNMNADQTMPTSKIGKEYFVVNGMTKTEAGMEKVIVVATKDGTKIYFNNDTEPYKTLNKGEHFISPSPNKKNTWIDGTQEGFRNPEPFDIPTRGMYVRTSQPVYLYQLIGGYNFMVRGPVPDRTDFTSGMLFSYPIDKDYLPDPRQKLSNTIEIPSVAKLGVVDVFNKITVKTPDNAAITFNGGSVTDFSTIPGKPGWSYFTRINYGGNISINSNKSLMVDTVGGFRYAGYGGGYTGFSNDPFIIKNGNCIEEGVFLYLNNIDFEGFQWKLDGVDITGETGSTITPKLPGNYTCVVSYMDFTFTTSPVRVDNCPYLVVEKNEGIQCHSFTLDASFSPPRPRDEVASTRILTEPFRGKAIIKDGVIFVKIDEDFSGENRLVYEIKGSSGFSQTVKVNFSVYPIPKIELKESIFPKGFRNTSYVYDLTEATLSNPDANKIKYFQTVNQNPGDEITGSLINNFSTNKTEIYAQITYGSGCTILREIGLIQTKIPDQPGDPNAILPNFFSPNNDGINDFWCYENLGNMSTLKLAIYDRYGTKVYEHTTNETCWDGKTKTGISFPTGTYWVYYIVTDAEGVQTQKSQWILLKNAN
ncbi:T9SS type B sorting domain-containing protein [Kaistella polysaccharea]|uniref:T9SS type B sorting domain-containing protein n=1 Tax=Kaistella polysaccharea TaxID=2878534 RepID=UPI001CF1FA2D|nr:gliding motility-associated C-terminal domain-containing protein [Kaistella polysaccharea]